MSRNAAAEGLHPLTRRQREYEERGRRTRRILFMVVGLGLLLAAAIPALGYYLVLVRPLQQPIVGVNDRSFDLGYVIGAARRTLLQGIAAGVHEPSATPEIIIGALNEVQSAELLRQAAPRLGITVTDQDIRQRLDALLGRPLGSEADDRGRPRAERSFDELYRQRLNVLQLSEEEFDDVIRADIIRAKLGERLKQDIPPGDEQVHVYVIQTDTVSQAEAVRKRLEAGEDFSKVAAAVSKHTLTNARGGDWGWYPHGVEPNYDDLWFSMKVGEVSEPVAAITGVLLFKIVDYASYREMTEDHARRLELSAVEDWLAVERKQNRVWQVWDQSLYHFVNDKLNEDPLLRAESGG